MLRRCRPSEWGDRQLAARLREPVAFGSCKTAEQAPTVN